MWHVPGANAIAGDYTGISEVLSCFHERRQLAADTLRLHPGEILVGDGSHVAVRTDGTATKPSKLRLLQDRMAAMDEHTQPHYERSALLTIDLQRDFLSDSPYGIAGTTEVLPAVRRLVKAYRAAGRPIVHVVRLYLPDGSNADRSRRSVLASGASIVRPGSRGAQLADGLTPDDTFELDDDQLLAGQLQRLALAEHAMFKPRWNAFYDTGLDDQLRQTGVDTVVVTGCNYPNCPRGTLFGASERDYRAVMVNDAVSQWNEHAGAELSSLGVVTAPTSEILAQLAEATKTTAPA